MLDYSIPPRGGHGNWTLVQPLVPGRRPSRGRPVSTGRQALTRLVRNPHNHGVEQTMALALSTSPDPVVSGFAWWWRTVTSGGRGAAA